MDGTSTKTMETLTKSHGVWKSCGWVWLFPISKKYLFHLFDIDTSHSKFFKKLIVSLSNMAESEVGF